MHIEDLYGIELSNGTINAVTDKLLPELQAWRERDLDAIYPIVWLDAIHYKIKENGRFISKAVYTLLGLNVDTISPARSQHLKRLPVGGIRSDVLQHQSKFVLACAWRHQAPAFCFSRLPKVADIAL